jgi:translation initiation factor IF-2
MPTHVYKLARELNFDKGELVDKINALSLGFTVNNHMSKLTDEQVELCKSAFDRERAGSQEKKRLGSGLIRRRSKKVRAAEAAAAQAPDRQAGPAIPAPPTPVGSESAPAPPAIVVEQPVEVAPIVVEAAVAEAPAPEQAVAPVATEPTPTPASVEVAAPVAAEAVADKPAVAEVAAVEAPAAPAAEVVAAPETPSTPAAPPALLTPTPQRQRGGRVQAQVLGRIDPTLLKKRLAAEGKNFAPPSARPASPGPRRPGAPAAPAAPDRTDPRGARRKKKGRRTVQAKDLYDNNAKIRQMHQRRRNKGKPGRTVVTQAAEHKRVIKVNEAILLSELARQMGVKGADIIRTLMKMGEMYTINQAVEVETAEVIAENYGYTVENVTFDISDYLEATPEDSETTLARPPVVTIMGHVDHGKTSLLDAFRESNITSQEFGGITQHIGAYQVQTERGQITFLDTPGHAAFTALRARGAQATDIVILVVAADDGVMPQTIEAINHSKDAGVPIIVAVNKMDKEGANSDRIKQALTEYELVPEEWGGETQVVEVSALKGDGLPALLDAILLQAELLELTANQDIRAQGVVIESRLDTGLGPVATCLIQAGTLRTGQYLVSGAYYGRVRRLVGDLGTDVTEAYPSTPVQVTGLSGVPPAGEPCFVVEDERKAREIVSHVEQQQRESELAMRGLKPATGLDMLTKMMADGDVKQLKVIIKGDVQGSVEAVKGTLETLGNDEVGVKVIRAAVGGITENDVNLAASSEEGAVIVGFNVRPESRAAALAEGKGVELILQTVIYEIEDLINAALEGMLKPILTDKVMGHAEVRQTFAVPKLGTIAGCYVQDGKVVRNGKCRVKRDGKLLADTTIATLRRFKDDVKEVKGGFECGLRVDGFNEVEIGDIIETYEIVEVRATL